MVYNSKWLNYNNYLIEYLTFRGGYVFPTFRCLDVSPRARHFFPQLKLTCNENPPHEIVFFGYYYISILSTDTIIYRAGCMGFVRTGHWPIKRRHLLSSWEIIYHVGIKSRTKLNRDSLSFRRYFICLFHRTLYNFKYFHTLFLLSKCMTMILEAMPHTYQIEYLNVDDYFFH